MTFICTERRFYIVSYLVEIELQRGSMIYLYYIYFYMDTLLASPQYSPDIGTS